MFDLNRPAPEPVPEQPVQAAPQEGEPSIDERPPSTAEGEAEARQAGLLKTVLTCYPA